MVLVFVVGIIANSQERKIKKYKKNHNIRTPPLVFCSFFDNVSQTTMDTSASSFGGENFSPPLIGNAVPSKTCKDGIRGHCTAGGTFLVLIINFKKKRKSCFNARLL